MREFLFRKEKYGFELLMDLHTLEGNPNLFFERRIHITDFFEVFFFEKGNGTIELNGNLIEVEDRSIFFISPFQKKSCIIDKSNVEGFHLVLCDDFMSDFFEDKLFVYRMNFFYDSVFPQHLCLNPEDFSTIKNSLTEITSEIADYRDDSVHIIRSLLYFSLAKLNRLYAQAYNLSAKTYGDSIAYQFKEVLEQEIRSLHSVQEYCQKMQVSRHQLNTSLKEHFGCTTLALIHNRLLQEIKTDLLYTDFPISKIAFELNFSESNNLTRFFKKMTGLSPSQFRANKQIDRKH